MHSARKVAATGSSARRAEPEAVLPTKLMAEAPRLLPYEDWIIADVPLILECKLLHTFEIGRHTQFIGEVMDVKAEEDVLGKDGSPNMKKVKPIVYVPSSDAYFGVGEYLGEAYSIGKKFTR